MIVTKWLPIVILAMIMVVAAGCSKTTETSTEATTKPGADNSEIATKVDASGVKTEERTFKGNPRIARVVVTTDKNGKRTVKAYSPSGEERPVKDDENVLTETGDKVADGAGFVVDKSKDVAGEAKSVGETAADKTVAVGEKTADTAKSVGTKTVDEAKKVGDKTVSGAKTVGDKTVSGAKTVGDKTVSGAKKAGDAVTKVIP
jgi:hypothetical protein